MAETEKAALRVVLGAARRARAAKALAADRAAIREHVLDLVSVHGWECIAAYEPLRTEPGSTQLLADLHASGVRVLVPITLADRDLDWVRWTPDRTDADAAAAVREAGSGEDALGRDAIGGAGLVLVPALAVAADGTRLGRGGGSYDRALARRGPASVVATLVFASEVRAWLPRDSWDRPVDVAITPDGVRPLGGNTAVAPAG